MKIFNSLNRILLLITLLAGFNFSLDAQSAEEGKTLFKANCTACHAINDKVVGPALKDVHKRREEAWLIKWIKNSQALIKSGDATAVQVYKENNESVMTAFENLSDNEVKSIIAYIKAESEAKAESASTATVAADPKSNNGTTPEEMASNINWLLFLVAILLIVVISYVFKILARIGDIQGRPTINWTKLNSQLLMAFLVIGMIAAFWEFFVHGKLTYFSMGAASEHGEAYDSMFMITLALTGVVFVITQALLFWYGFKYKNDGTRKALYFPDNHKLELIWTVVPAIVLTILVVRGLLVWNSMMYTNKEDARNIEVFGYQFGWDARLAGNDNKLGAHNFREVGKVNALGVDQNDPNAKDDIIVKELHLEVNKPVNFYFRAKDVIHSAYFPHFRAQMNVVPGLPTKFSFTPTVTTADMRSKIGKPEFDYVLLCNKICGAAHYRMKMVVVVDSPADYQKWLKSQKTLVNNSTPSAQTTASN
ncbi:MAG: c-type cytochrome [Bacteroidia bacterium]|nr:c-type cytochrome [Bacteroidia bacterium]